MLYNLPSATGVNLSPATVGQLAREVDNIRYIKDTSADMAQAGCATKSCGSPRNWAWPRSRPPRLNPAGSTAR
jgi:dihydrodipicolinate synthase/N-acetylneuraminate lyase